MKRLKFDTIRLIAHCKLKKIVHQDNKSLTMCDYNPQKAMDNRRAPPYNSNQPGCHGVLKTGVDGQLYISVPNINGQHYWKRICPSNTRVTGSNAYTLLDDNNLSTTVYLQQSPVTALVAPYLYPTTDDWYVLNGVPVVNKAFVDLSWLPLAGGSYDSWLASRQTPILSSLVTRMISPFM